MHKLIGVACRRTAGMTAGVILTGGLVGGVLLTPGTAYAAGPTTVGTTTTVSGTATSSSVNVSVTVTAASGTVSPTGNVNVHGAGGGCSASLSGSGGASSGSCSIPLGHVRAGTYTLNASYGGSGSFASSFGTGTVTISPTTPTTPTGPTSPTSPTSSAPVFTAADPPSTVTGGQSYSYGFRADGCSAPWYALGGAPGWMQINQQTGFLWGTVPSGGSSFGYSVTAWCGNHSVTRWFWVYMRQFFRHRVNVDTYLWCTSPVFTGQRGTCTLSVSNRGNSSASDVSAQIALPWQLRADYCGYFYSFNFGCSIYGNTAYENLGTLYPGQYKSLTVVFTARTGFNLFGWHHGYRFPVRVVGSASSNGYYSWSFFGQRESVSYAYVTIIPRGHWW
jgi:hypothetical protein